MSSSITPNMGLIVPGIATEPGPTWGSDLNSSLGILDQHDHSSGSGVQITPSGININSDLSINNNNLTNIKTANFTNLSMSLAGSAPNLGCIYVAGKELYYNDEAGNVVQITNMGSVNAGAGSITGLPSGTASASYSAGSGTFIWQSATSTSANLDSSSITIREQVANAKGVTLNSPTALASDYQLNLPTGLPGATTFLTLDTSGNIGASTGVYPIDNVTLNVSGGLLQVAPSGLTQSNANINAVSFVIPGMIQMWGGASAPTGFFICDGSAVSRTTYAALFAAIGTNYGYGDGSTTFNIPDMRGLFPRGVDNGAGRDPDTASRTAINPGGNTGDNVGSYQTSDFTSHSHVEYASANAIAGANPYVQLLNSAVVTTVSTNNSTAATGGNETRPVNIYVNFIIKY